MLRKESASTQNSDLLVIGIVTEFLLKVRKSNDLFQDTKTSQGKAETVGGSNRKEERSEAEGREEKLGDHMGYVAAARLTAVHQRHHLHLSESSRARPQLSPPSAPPEQPPQSLTQLSPQAASPPPSSVLTLGQVNPWSADLLPDYLSVLERAQGGAEPLVDRRPLTNETQGQLALDFEREFSLGLWSCAFPKASMSQGALFLPF